MASSSDDADQFPHHVIVGGGIAGVSCAEELARLRPKDSITLVSASRSLRGVANVVRVTDSLEKFDVVERPLNFLEVGHDNVHCIEAEVVGADFKNKTVALAGGKELRFTQLCIACGASPDVILEHPLVLGVRDSHSIEELAARLTSDLPVLVVGNGAIAVELVHAISTAPVHWALRESYMGHTFFDASASDFLSTLPKPVTQAAQPADIPVAAPCAPGDRLGAMGNAVGPQWLTLLPSKGGVQAGRQPTLHTECHVAAIRQLQPVPGVAPGAVGSWSILSEHTDPTSLPDGLPIGGGEAPLQVALSDGTLLCVGAVVSATGVNPNTAWCAAAGLPLASCGGVVVNKYMQSSTQASVFAAGDAAAVHWPSSPVWFQMRTWSQARTQGTYAAWCMGGAVPDVPNSPSPPPQHPPVLQRLAEIHRQLDAGLIVDDEDDLLVGGGAFDVFAHMTTLQGLKVVLLGLYNGQGLGDEYQHAIQNASTASDGSIGGVTGLKKCSPGAAQGGAGPPPAVQVLYRSTPGVEYVKLVLVSGRVVGAMLLGDTDLEETAENLIQSRLNVGALGLDLLHADLDLEDFFD